MKSFLFRLNFGIKVMLLLCYKLKTSPIFILKETAWLLHARQGYLLQLYVQSICTLSSFLDRFNVSPSATIELLNRMAKVVWMLCVLTKYFYVISVNTFMHTCMKLHFLQPATMKVYIHTYILFNRYSRTIAESWLRNLYERTSSSCTSYWMRWWISDIRKSHPPRCWKAVCITRRC